MKAHSGGLTFCFFCDHDVSTHRDGRIRDHRGSAQATGHMIGVQPCPGSDLLPETVREMVAYSTVQRALHCGIPPQEGLKPVREAS